jgi:proliferating cell nuclear antigen
MSPETQTDTDTEAAFTATVSKDELSELLDPVQVFVDECKIRLNDDGINIRAVDPANVGMVDAELPKEALEQYEATSDVIGVNLERLDDIISMADNGALIDFTLDPRTRKLKVVVDGLEYTMALIDPDSIRQEPDLPDLDLAAEVVLTGKELNRGITAADMVSDHGALAVDPDDAELEISAEGDTDDAYYTLGEDKLINISPGPAHSLFSLDYLKDVKKPIPKDAEVTLEIGDEFPVKAHYNSPDTAAQITFMVAPRIQSD